MKVLIAEDEKHLSEGLRFNLEAEGFDVEVAADGAEALQMLALNKADLIILDVMMPRVDGFTVAKNLRDARDFTPILMLTALGKPEDVLRGFEAGADDYLPKPFDLNVFIARVNALLRRREWFAREQSIRSDTHYERTKFEIGTQIFDFENLTLHSETETVPLTLMEAKLLKFLIESDGKPVSRKTILEDVWQLHEDTDTRAIDNFIVRLRRLIETDAANPQILQTVRGVGYRMVLN